MSTDHATELRQEFIAACSDPYAAKRQAAIEILRQSNAYVLDADSKPYIPSNGKFPAAMVSLRTSL